MADFLNNLGSALTNPRDAAVMGLAQGLLAASGASPRPVNLGQALAAGMNQSQQYQARQAQTNAQLMSNQFMQWRLGQLAQLMGGNQPTGDTGEPIIGGSAPAHNPQTGLTEPVSQNTHLFTQPASSQASNPQTGNPLTGFWGDLYKRGMLYNLAGLKGGGAMISAALSNSPQVQAEKSRAVQIATQKLSIDRQKYQEALQNGDKQAADMWYTKMLTDSGQLHVADYNGVTTLLGRGPNGKFGVQYFMNPNRGTGYTPSKNEFLLPGEATVQGTIAGARKAGETAGSVQTGVVTKGPHKGLEYKAPGYVVYPNLVSHFEGGNSSVAPQPNSEDSGVPSGAIPTKLSPYAERMLAERGSENAQYLDDLQKAADDAKNVNYALDEMRQTIGHFTPGKFTSQIEGIKNALAGVGAHFGLKAPTDLSNYLQFTKYANKVAFAATRKMGAREAYQIVKLQMESNPNPDIPRTASMGILDSMHAMNDYINKKNELFQTWASNDPSVTNTQMQAKWTKQVDPQVWDMPLNGKDAIKVYNRIGSRKVASSMQYMDTDKQFETLKNLPQTQASRVLSALRKLNPHAYEALHAYAVSQ